MKLLLIPFFLFTFGSHAQNIWTECPLAFSDSNHKVRKISIANENVVWTFGTYRTIEAPNNLNYHPEWAKSVDGGITWTHGTIDLGNPNYDITSIEALSATTAYITAVPSTITTAGMGGVWVTQDGGITWAKQTTAAFNDSDSFPFFIHFWDAQNGITGGDPANGYFEIYTTTDGGQHWTRSPQQSVLATIADEYYQYRDYNTRNFTVANNTVWFFSTLGRIFKSSDRGMNWSAAWTPITEDQLLCDFGDCPAFHCYSNENIGFLQNDQLYKTTDGSSNWILQSTPENLKTGQLLAIPETPGSLFSVGFDFDYTTFGSSYSTDGGQTFTDLNTVDPDPVLPIFAEFKNSAVAYCTGYQYDSMLPAQVLRFYRLNDPLNRFLKTEDFNLKDKFSLSQNPTAGTVKLLGTAIEQVSIIDTTGKIVFSQNYNSLNDVSIDMAPFENGIYLANITNNSGKVSTLKIVKK